MNIKNFFKSSDTDIKITRIWEWDWTKVFNWDNISITTPQQIMKVFDHLKTSKSIEVFVWGNLIYYRADTEKFGLVEGCWDKYFSEFQFRVIKYGTLYKIPLRSIVYGVNSKRRFYPEIQEFVKWLEDTFKPFLKAYEEERSL